MTKKYFETESFAQMNAEWNQKLAASGFEDIEATENGVVRPQIFTAQKTQYVGGANYYEYCQLVLRTFPFKRDLERVVFEYHAEGKSEREIATWLAENAHKEEFEHLRLKPLTNIRVHQIIKRIKEDFGRL